MANPKKIYDFPFEKVKQQVTTALRKNAAQATVADLVGLSGLPKHQVESVLPVVVNECRGQMRVTESGEILYNFPRGLSNQVRGAGAAWKKFLRTALSWTGRALAFLFKIWIVVMLVGYFALFVFILIAALVISIAMSFAKRDDRDDGGGFMGFYLVGRVFEFFLYLWLYSGDPQIRVSKKKKPFHKAVFEFVFGVEEKPEVREIQIRKAAIAFVRDNRGSISLEELMRLTGKSREDADALISRLLLEYEGEPQVSEEGTLYFFFPELLKTASGSTQVAYLADQDLIPFSNNPAATNRWIGFLNGFNIVLGGYFLAFGLQGIDTVSASRDPLSIVYKITIFLISQFFNVTPEAAQGLVVLILGIIPVVYSALFFGIPLVRRWREGLKNLRRKLENFRKKLVAKVLNNPLEIHLAGIEPDSERSAAGKVGAEREALKEGLLRDLAGNRSVEVEGSGPFVYSVPDLAREKQDLARVREKTDLKAFQLGKVVFDTEKPVE